MRKLVVGSGYLGQRVAQLWRDQGDEVYTVTRSVDRAAELKQLGFEPVVADILLPESLSDLPVADAVLMAVGYDRSCGSSIHDVYVTGLRHLLDALPEHSGSVVYVSSTGVYGQNDGSWVDERSPCAPRRAGGRACLAAEQALVAHRRGVACRILRLSGIYGPGRLPRAADLAAGKPMPAPPDGYLNLIHVDDAARIVLAAARREVADEQPLVYTVSDGAPTTRHAYFERLAHLLGAPSPQFDDREDVAARRDRGTTSKRIDNRRMLRELAVRLEYPSFREGLAAIVDGR